MRTTKRDPKKYILPHSEAKLKLYSDYLKRYLRIMSLIPYIDRINIFDIFCGTGIYQDGKKGSPILAFEIIKSLFYEYKSSGKKLKPIRLIINDGKTKNIDKVKQYLTEQNKREVCEIDYYGLESTEMFAETINIIKKQSSSEKNIIFIDPYGYKEIHKNDIFNLLKNNQTEIILFLPISHMYRFKGIALNDFDNVSYIKLRNFIHEFFQNGHPVFINNSLKISEFIKYIKESLAFQNKYFSTSFYIQRDKSNYNAIFLITPNILGFEKIIEVKWDLDSKKGEGYRLIDLDSLFDKEPFSELEVPITKLLKEGKIKNNIDLYLVTLLCEHTIKHMNDLIRIWKSEGKIEVRDIKTDSVNNKGTYLNYKEYKKNNPKVYFNLLK